MFTVSAPLRLLRVVNLNLSDLSNSIEQDRRSNSVEKTQGKNAFSRGFLAWETENYSRDVIATQDKDRAFGTVTDHRQPPRHLLPKI